MQETLLAIILLPFAVMLLSTMVAWLQQKSIAHSLLLDIPVARSAHILPTPTGGGIAIVLGFYTGYAMLIVTGPVYLQEVVIIGMGLVLAVLGLLDDLKHLDFKWRIAVHLGVSLLVATILGELPALQVGQLVLHPGIFSFPLIVLLLTWSINLYNFMDGIDGLAASECCFITLSASCLLLLAGDFNLASVSLILCAASAGFLLWNWPQAKIFMGDIGSGFLGFMLCILALLSIYHQSMSPWSWVLLPGVFIADATLTVLRRMWTGQVWYQAHSTHAYQHAARRFGHLRVTVAILLINLFWLLPLACLAQISPEYGVYLVISGIVPLLLLAYLFGAGQDLVSGTSGNLERTTGKA